MEKKTENKLYTIIGIIGLLSIVCFIIYLIGSFICFGIKTTYDIGNRPTTYIDSCDNTNMLEPNNDSSRPVKGMKYTDSIDSLVFSNHTDLSGIDGDNFYSRDLNPSNRNITPRVNNYTSYNNDNDKVEVEVKLPTKVILKPSMIQVFSDRISYDITYSY